MKGCCPNPTFQLIEELGRANAADWDFGQCTSCGTHLLRIWSEFAPEIIYCKVTGEEAAAF